MKKRPTASAAAAAAPAAPAQPLRYRLLRAVELLKNEQIDEAEPLLMQVLEGDPNQADALHFLGVLRHTQGRFDDAVALIRHSLQVLPDNASAWNNLGNVLLLAGRLQETVEIYERAVARADNVSEATLALNNLCTLHRKLGALESSEASARDALQRDPKFGDAWYNLSLTLLKQGRVHDGLIAHSHAVALWPESTQPRHEVVRSLMLLGELERASKLLAEWLAEDTSNPVARHLLAACEAGLKGTAPERASDGYVQQVFDSFAASFDSKLQALGYRAPELVVQALAEALGGEPRAAFEICDAGAGTGLCAAGLKPWSRSLVACDLSAGMLKRAGALRLYDRLVHAELTQFLNDNAGAYDAVVSADTLCYFGALEAALAAARRSLKAGGWLVFTVEALPADHPQPHLLQANGRYAHARAYVERVLGDAGYTSLSIQGDTLRQEAGEPVRGWVVRARAPA
jgi:predicted TPR repeat methyltransferase/Tfp pilus assembly protein PilF